MGFRPLLIKKSSFPLPGSEPTKYAELLLGMIVAASVLALGAVRPQYWMTAAAVTACLAAYLFLKTGMPEMPLLASGILLLLVLAPLFQLLPLPPALVGLLSPNRLATEHRLFSAWKFPQEWPCLSISPHHTWLGFLKLVSYLLVFLVGFQIYQKRGSSKVVLLLAGLGAIEALMALVQFFTGWQIIHLPGRSGPTGTYVSPNNYAGLLEMALPLVLAQFAVSASSQGGRSRSAASGAFFGRFVYQICFAIILLGLIFSKSTMGIIGGLAGIAVVLSLGVRRQAKAFQVAVLAAALIVPAVYSGWLGFEPIMKPLENAAGSSKPGGLYSKFGVWEDSWKLVRDYPVLGTGLGTYESAILQYQSAFLDLRYEHAHNDYLEFASELGIPCALVLFGGILLLVIKASELACSLERTEERILAAGTTGAIVAILGHSITDFNLQIPANALLFSWILGTTVGLLASGRENRHILVEPETRARFTVG